MKRTLFLFPPGRRLFSITLFMVPVQILKYPESIAGFETSITKTNVGGIGGRFIYSFEAIKSTAPLVSSFLL